VAVKPQDPHVPPGGEAEPYRFFQDPEGHLVRPGEDVEGRGGLLQEVAEGEAPPLLGVAGDVEPVGGEGAAGLLQGLLEARHPFGEDRAAEGPVGLLLHGDGEDGPREAGEVGPGEPSPQAVVQVDGVVAGVLRVHQHHGALGGQPSFLKALREVVGGEDEAVGEVGQGGVLQVALKPGQGEDGEEGEVVALLQEDALNPLHEPAVELGGHEGEEDAHRVAPPPRDPAGVGVGRVAQLLHGPKHPGPGLVTHRGVVVEDPAHGAEAHARLGRHVVDGGLFALHRSLGWKRFTETSTS